MKTEYNVIKHKKPKCPPRNVLEITGDRGLLTSLELFGPNYFNRNVESMQKKYSLPNEGHAITFREPTTAQSILAASYDFRNRVQPKILNPTSLQLGRAVLTSEGVLVNFSRLAGFEGFEDKTISEDSIKTCLGACKKVNGIWLYQGDSRYALDMGFAPYETFKQGNQDAGEFAEGGLARVLEHTKEKKAKILGKIASKKNYPNGVRVLGFDSVKIPVVFQASLYSGVGFEEGVLGVVGAYFGNYGKGYAFGVVKEE